MCGIAGYFGPNKFSPSKREIKNCINLMKRRGPDFQGIIEKKVDNNNMLMLHSRLSIIDPSKNSHQPMEDINGIIAFNGEIYNYIELKNKYKFSSLKTNSDTEILLKYLNHSKKEKQQDLDGMWAYSYFCKKKKELILSRDRFGEKPLYYLYDGIRFYYGSNINYILALSKKKITFNEKKISMFLSHGFRSLCVNNNTFFNEIKMLDPASKLSIKSNKLKIKKYWEPSFKYKSSDLSYSEATKILRKNIINVFAKRFRSDFPMACLLSGGVDSTSIAGVAKSLNDIDLKCFSIKPENEFYDETPRIKKFSKKIGYKENYIKMNKINNFNFLNDIISDSYSPICSVSYLAYAHLNKAINQEGFRVLLQGSGGDEIFGGYYTHHMNYLISNKNKKNFKRIYNDWKKHVKPLIRSKILSNLNEYNSKINRNFSSFHEQDEINNFISNTADTSDVREKKYFKSFFRNRLAIDLFRDMIPPQLLSSDQVSMYFSIENRCPFLSKELFELANSLPENYLMKDGYGKAILRDSMKNFVPNEILKFREKIGFNADISTFFELKSKKFKDTIFQSSFINSFINVDKVNKLLSQKKLSNAEGKFVFCLLNLSILSNLA